MNSNLIHSKINPDKNIKRPEKKGKSKKTHKLFVNITVKVSFNKDASNYLLV